MLKAYIVTENVHCESSVLLFAENPNKAKQQALTTENLEGFEYIALSVRRAKYADGYENATERELMILNIQNGWWYEIGGKYIDSDNLDKVLEEGLL